jgi:hypothetical protein
MPHPIAHPAAAIPLKKYGLVLSALIIGSLAPDLGYLGPLRKSMYVYTVEGTLLFNVPVGLGVLIVFHWLVKWPILSLLPGSWQRRLVLPAQGFSFGPAKRFCLILLSLLVGSITHVLWDSFTHGYGWLGEHVSFFSTRIGGMRLYDVLQNLSTLIGVILLIYWFLKWFPSAPQVDRLPARFRGPVQEILVAVTALTLVVVEGFIIYSRLTKGGRHAHIHHLLGSTVYSAVFIISFFVGLYCLVWTLAFRRNTQRADPQ